MRDARQCVTGKGWAVGVAVLLAIGVTACPADRDEQVAAEPADPAAILNAWEALLAAWEAQDVEGVLRAFTENAIVFDPVPPGKFEGQTGIRNWAAGAFDAFEEISIDTEQVQVATEGPVGWVMARYTFRGTPLQGEAYVDEGYVSALWTLAADGTYRSPLFHASVLPEGQAEDGAEGSPAEEQGGR